MGINLIESIKGDQIFEYKFPDFLNESNKIGNSADDFEVLQVLGSGAYGNVLKVKSKKNLEIYAMKKVNKNLIRGTENEKYYKNEKLILSKLQSPLVCKCYAIFEENDFISNAYISNLNTNTGEVTLTLEAPEDLYTQVLNDVVGISVNSKAELLRVFIDFSEGKSEYDNIKDALKQVYTTGYGIVTPRLSDLKLEEPEVIKQAGRYGVKLKAIATSIHMIKVDVESTFEPIIGTEMQSKELIDHLMKDKNEDPSSIWKSEIFGRSLDNIIQEGIQAKVAMMPENIRYKLQNTLTKVVNKGSNNMIAIVI